MFYIVCIDSEHKQVWLSSACSKAGFNTEAEAMNTAVSIFGAGKLFDVAVVEAMDCKQAVRNVRKELF